MNDIPMIWTSKGNIPLDSLKEEVHWIDNEEETTCVNEWWLDGECVKRAVHIFKRKGLETLAQARSF